MVFYSRKSPRIKKYDYSTYGYYFVTVCTNNKECLFGTAEKINDFGIIAQEDLYAIESHYKNIKIDKCVIMPNHIHAIIAIEDSGACNLNTVIGQDTEQDA